jgi:molecular chaperone DnaK (HSP70)
MNRALVIGCSDYEDPDIAPLRYAHRDAERAAEVLRFACGVDEGSLVVLHDGSPAAQGKATRTNILRQLTRLTRTAGDADVLFFFFSGHGFQAADGTHYLLPVDCLRDAIEDTALPFDLVVRHLASARAPHVLLLLDACRNVVDAGKGAGEALANVDVNALCPPGVVTFCSCRPGTVSYESDGIESGIFTYALCEAFSDSNRCRTVYEFDSYLNRRVPEISAEQGKPIQNPHSRVEPLGVQKLELVSERKRNEWRAATPIGTEQRYRRTPYSTIRTTGNPLIAIDLGTSYSAVAYCGPDGKVHLIPGPDGRPLVPSVVHFLPGLDYLVGSAAVEADHYRPAATIRYAKRDLGSDVSYDIDGRSVAPELAASLVVRSLVRNAEEALGESVHTCLAARPANFTRRQVEALGRAFELADVEVFRIVGEPNIASVLTASPETDLNRLVVDLGGGTFDVALVEAGEGVAEIKAAAGSNQVGGLDFDAAVAAFVMTRLREDHGWDGDLPNQWQAAIRREAERAKRDLGRHESSTILLQDLDYGDHGLRDVSIDIDRTTFREITRSLNRVVRETLASPFEQAGVKISSWISDGGKVVLAGQGGKIFTVQEQIADLLPGTPVISEFQETAVVQGLGLYTGVLRGLNRGVLLLDALGFGIGLRVKHGTSSVISGHPAENTEVAELIMPQTTIPTKRSEIFELSGEGETILEIVETSVAGNYPWCWIPVLFRDTTLEVTIDIDANHTTVVITKDLKTGDTLGYQLNNINQLSQFHSGTTFQPVPNLGAPGWRAGLSMSSP